MRKLLIKAASLKDALVIEPTVIGDMRGFRLESYSEVDLADSGVNTKFIQDVHEMTRSAGVIRGLHYQIGDAAQAKLIRVTRGKIFQVIVDIRKGSPTYGKWEGFYLSEHNKRVLYIPKGFAHGYLTLTGDVDVMYKVDQYDDPAAVRGINFNCPKLGIEWQYDECMLFSTLEDEAYPTFDQFEKMNSFEY